MSRTAEIEKVSLAVQIDGKVYFVNLSQDKLRLVVNLAASLDDSGSLRVVRAPAEYQFTVIEASDATRNNDKGAKADGRD